MCKCVCVYIHIMYLYFAVNGDFWNWYLCRANDENALEIDFGEIDFLTPRTALPSSIGNGLTFISKFMSSKLTSNSGNARELLEYLQALYHRGEVYMCIYTSNWKTCKLRVRTKWTAEIFSRCCLKSPNKPLLLRKLVNCFFVFAWNTQRLMINETVDTVDALQGALIVAEAYVSTQPKDTPFQGFEQRWPFSLCHVIWERVKFG